MKNLRKINQIWVGSPLPEREQEWTATIRRWAIEQGIEYHLWTLEELARTYPDEPIWAFVNELDDNVKKYVLLADYFRVIIMSNGQAYLDTDFLCHHQPQINIDGNKALYLGEFWDGKKPCNGLFVWQDNFQHGDKIKDAARKHVADLGDDWADDLCECFGPSWTRKIFQQLNIQPLIFPRHIATHIQWKNQGCLIHQGAGSWVSTT